MKDIPKKPDFINKSLLREIPSKPNNINSNYTTDYNYTVSMILSYNKIIPPNEWNHDKYLTNIKGETV